MNDIYLLNIKSILIKFDNLQTLNKLNFIYK